MEHTSETISFMASYSYVRMENVVRETTNTLNHQIGVYCMVSAANKLFSNYLEK